MHYRLALAIPGATASEDVFDAALDPLYSYSEENLVDSEEVGFEPGCGEWDWVAFGGRFRGAFTLTPEAVELRRTESLHGPLDGKRDESDGRAVFHRLGIVGSIPRELWPEDLLPHEIDCARLCDIEVGLIPTPVYWIDLDQRLHEIDYLDERQHDIDTRRFRDWVQTLASDTWLINVDVHR